jgi:hypothetical protein
VAKSLLTVAEPSDCGTCFLSQSDNVKTYQIGLSGVTNGEHPDLKSVYTGEFLYRLSFRALVRGGVGEGVVALPVQREHCPLPLSLCAPGGHAMLKCTT